MSTFNAESGQESSEIGPAEKQDKTSESKSNVVTFRSHNTKRAPKYLAGEKTGYIAPSAKPSDGMVPADYVGKCKATSIVAKGNKKFAQLLHEITEGKYAGTELRQWEEIKATGKIIEDRSVYYEQCSIALGGQITPGESLDPEDVFVGKTFVLRVGYSSKDEHGRIDPKNTARKKYERDHLRVHRILDVVP